MEWLALDARLEQKKKAKIRKQQRELKKKQQEQEAREQQLRKLAQRCAEMQREERLSIAMEQFYKDEAERKRLEMKREEDMKIFREVANARKRAQELGLPVSTPGLAGLERLRELETRIAEKEDALQRAAMAKQRLDALPKKKLMLKKVMGRYFASSLQKKVERAVYHQECDHLLSLFDPESHTSGNRAEVLLSHESKNGFTPVLAAIFCKKLSILRRLLEIGASPNFETSWGMTPLLGSIMTDDIVALSILMEFQVDLNYEAKRGMRALHVAADKGRLELLKVLLRGGADVNATNAQGRSPLMQAAVSNHLEAARILVAFGADKLVRDQSGMAALDWATKLKLPHMVSFLSSSVSSSSLFAQISEEEEGDSTVKTASSAGNAAHQRRTKLLESAMRDRDLRRLRQLLEDPSFSPNYEDSSGNTPFSVVCEVGSCDDILFCLDRKAVPTHQNRSGINALMVACYRGETDMLELLISAGCNLLTRDYKGWDCYRYLNKHDHPDVVETLTRKYREVKSKASPSFLLGNPLLSTEELRKDFAAPLRRVQGFKESTNEPEVGNDMETRSRRSTRPTEATVGGCSDESDRTSNESGDESLSDPAQDPGIRKWAARQQVLKHNRRRRSDFEHERERILLATKRGRRNGLIAPLPGDSGGRKKFPSCENCKRRRARKRCLECEQALCDECHARLHELAHRRHHRFDELEPQLYIGHELKEVIQERQATSLGHFVEKSKECVASMRSLLQSGSEHQPAKTADSAKADPEVERFEWKQRLAREKEVMQTQINVPAAAAQHAARAGEGEIFVNPAEIDLANLYIVQKKYEKAKELLLQTQKLVGESIGVLHPTMLKVSIGLAKIYQVWSVSCLSFTHTQLAIHQARAAGNRRLRFERPNHPEFAWGV